MSNQIGLEAVLGMSQFTKSADQYNAYLKEMGVITDQQADAMAASFSKIDAAYKKTGSEAPKAGGSFIKSLVDIKSAIDIGVMAFQQIVDGMRQVYAAAKEGAALELMIERFGRLSASIDTTSDALLVDMKKATKGLVSDAELMQSATDFMSLGLANTHDEVVRLTRVAGALGMNMNQLVLTLTNQTTMRFDALGVSVDGFDEKLADLKRTGMDTNKAFTEAFLQQAEAQIARVGEMADTSAGQIARMEASVANLGDALKLRLAPAAADAANGLYFLISYQTEMDAAIAQGRANVEATAQSYEEYYSRMLAGYEAANVITPGMREQADAYYQAALQVAALEQQYGSLSEARIIELQQSGEISEAYAAELYDTFMLSEAYWGIIDGLDIMADSKFLVNAATETLTKAHESEVVAVNADIAANDALRQQFLSMGDTMERTTEGMESLADGARDYRDAVVSAAEKSKALEDAQRSLVGATGNLDGSFANNATLARNMLDEWAWAQAGGQSLNDIIVEIGGLQVEPEVKRELLEQALTTSVALEIGLNNLTEYEGAAMLKDALDLSSLEEAEALLGSVEGGGGVLGAIDALDKMTAEVSAEFAAGTEAIVDRVIDAVGTWTGTHTAIFEAVYREWKSGGTSLGEEYTDIGATGVFDFATSWGTTLGDRLIEAVIASQEGKNWVDDLVSAGMGLSSFAGYFAQKYKKDTLDPLAAGVSDLDEQIAELQEYRQTLLADDADQSHLIANQNEINRLMKERSGMMKDIADGEAQILKIQEQQNQMAFLEQQMKMLDFIKSYGLDPTEILGGMKLGLDASVPDLMEAMSAAMQKVIEAANNELGIHSPSDVAIGWATNIVGTFADKLEGLANYPATAMTDVMDRTTSIAGAMSSAPLASSTSYSRTANINFGGVTMNNGMDVAVLETVIRRVVRSEIGATV